MKKLSFLVVAGAMMAFASCGNTESTENATQAEVATNVEEPSTANVTATPNETPAKETPAKTGGK